MSKIRKLANCPFCGGPADIDDEYYPDEDGGREIVAFCRHCHTIGESAEYPTDDDGEFYGPGDDVYEESLDEAAKNWNRRAQTDINDRIIEISSRIIKACNEFCNKTGFPVDKSESGFKVTDIKALEKELNEFAKYNESMKNAIINDNHHDSDVGCVSDGTVSECAPRCPSYAGIQGMCISSIPVEANFADRSAIAGHPSSVPASDPVSSHYERIEQGL